jgi:hypothetical protein
MSINPTYVSAAIEPSSSLMNAKNLLYGVFLVQYIFIRYGISCNVLNAAR